MKVNWLVVLGYFSTGIVLKNIATRIYNQSLEKQNANCICYNRNVLDIVYNKVISYSNLNIKIPDYITKELVVHEYSHYM